MQINVKTILYGSSEYQLEVVLRSKVLREPLGRRLTEEDLAQDVGDIHIVAFSDSALVGCLILKRQSEAVVKMRQVAVDPERQGQGVGKMLVAFAEEMSVELGFGEIVLNARHTAVPFYKSLGYEAVGDAFDEVSIPHFKMKKRLKG